MKISKSFNKLTVFFLLIVFGCSNEPVDTTGLNNNNNQITSITLSVSDTSVNQGDDVTFTVTTNTGQNVTSMAAIQLDGSNISSSTYTCNDVGNFTFTALYDGLTSNSVTVTVDQPVGALTLLADVTTIDVGDDVTFTVTEDGGTDVTSSSTIEVDGSALAGNVFTGQTPGTYDVIATYNGSTSNTVTITVNAPPVVKFLKNVFIEDFTGTWCGYCPRVSYAIEEVKSQTTQVVVMASHLSASGAPDPYHNSVAVALANAANVSGLPTATLDRTTEWTYPEPNNIPQALANTGDNADLGIALSPSMSGNNLSVDVSVKFGEEFGYSSAKLAVYLLEDGLIYNQANYTSYYGGVNPIGGFEHNDVVRASFTTATGDAIPSSELTAGNTYTTNLSMTLPSSVSNSGNIKVVAVVTSSSNTAINVREAHFGDTQDFEEVN